MRKIGIFGPSGTGKSKLANWVSENYNIEYLDLSSKLIWEDMGVDSHQEIIDNSAADPEWGIMFQGTLLAMRGVELDRREYSFVTDRTPLDSIVYMLLQSSPHLTDEETDNFIKMAITVTLNNYTHLIGVPITRIPQDDGKRIPNYRYQQVTNLLYKWVVENFLNPQIQPDSVPRIMTLTNWDWEIRKTDVRNFVSPFML